jgi:protein TonB
MQDLNLFTGALVQENNAQARFAKTASLAFQLLLVTSLLLLPLMQTVSLPALPALMLVPMMSDTPVVQAEPAHAAVAARTTNSAPVLNVKARVYDFSGKSDPSSDPGASQPEPGGCITGCSGLPSNGLPGGLALAGVAPPVVRAAQPTRIRVSEVRAGSIEHMVQPLYPLIARHAHVEGDVVLSAIIDPEGKVESLQVVSGPAMLVGAALNAVKQWRFTPYLLNGAPVEVDTHVTVHFNLQTR